MKLFRSIAALVVGLSVLANAHGQNYPSKPVRLIVPYQAGQGTDVASRLIAIIM